MLSSSLILFTGFVIGSLSTLGLFVASLPIVLFVHICFHMAVGSCIVLRMYIYLYIWNGLMCCMSR